MNWWWTDDELMMNWWWTDDELMMNSWWTADEQLMNSWWTAGLVWFAKDYHRLPQTTTDCHWLIGSTPLNTQTYLRIYSSSIYIPDSTNYKRTASGANNSLLLKSVCFRSLFLRSRQRRPGRSEMVGPSRSLLKLRTIIFNIEFLMIKLRFFKHKGS